MPYKQFVPTALTAEPDFTSLLHPLGFKVTLFAQ